MLRFINEENLLAQIFKMCLSLNYQYIPNLKLLKFLKNKLTIYIFAFGFISEYINKFFVVMF